MVFQKGNTVRLGIKHTEETKLKMSESRIGIESPMLGKHHSEETKKNMSEAKKGKPTGRGYWQGKKFTEEHKEKIGLKSKGRISWSKGKTGIFSEEVLKKISEKSKGNTNCLGKKYSEERKQKISIATSGENNPNYGKHWNEEIKEKIRQANLGRKATDEAKEKMGKSHIGFKHTEESKKKMGLAKLGKKFSEEHKGNMSLCRLGKMSGEKNPNWNGGLTPINRLIRNSIEAKNWKISVFKRDNYTCQKCNVRGGTLRVHHIKSFAEYPELRFDINNGITYCEDCHKHSGLHKKKLQLVN